MSNPKPLTRRHFLRSLAAGAAALGPLSAALASALDSSGAKRPNVVVILADDQRFDALGCMGHPFAKTPSTDRLAAEGVLFTNALVSTPLCGPNRACLFTGCFAHNHRLHHNGTNVPDPAPMPVPCFPALMRDAGYRTALFGKFHAGDSTYADHGFQTFEPVRHEYFDPEFEEEGAWVRQAGHLTEILPQKASAWIKQASASSEPFLAVVTHIAPHMPTSEVPPAYKKFYQYAQPQRRPNVNDTSGEGKSEHIRQAQQWFASMRESGKIPRWTFPPPWSDEQIRDRMRLNKALDDSVGIIYQTLQDLGILEETIIIYHSDNGYFLGEHGLSEKYYPYEEGLRVPLIVRLPGQVQAGLRLDQPAYTLDLAPSILDWCGLEVPDSMDGASLRPLVDSRGQTPWRTDSLHEFFYHEGLNPRPTWQAVRNRDWKYIRFHTPPDEELYDLVADPYEIKNLAEDPQAAEKLQTCRARLDELIRQTKGEPIALNIK